MAVPTYDEFIEPLLRYLSAHPAGVSVSDAYDALADRVKLTVAERTEMLPSGAQAVFRNRIGWANDRLKRAGLSESPKRGIWKLTSAGLARAGKGTNLTPDEIDGIAYIDRSSRLRPKRESDGTKSPPVGAEVRSSPEERIDAALIELRESVGRDLLEAIGRAPPTFFEHLVLKLLHAMGYGTSLAALQRVGGSGDGGIDGIISLDRLGLEKVYVQAKRWKSSVGSPEIQGFMGALQLQGATKGVFLATSTFTKDAKDAAAKARGSIVLVDGAQLSAYMIDHCVGVTHKPLQLPRMDSDFFEEG
ncbi:restriction endonuclease [soil metagenome]